MTEEAGEGAHRQRGCLWHTAWWPWVAAAAMDLGVGLSLGMYYTVTYYGRSLVPLPGFVAAGAPFQYYLVVGDVQDAVVQSWLWMACFPAVGVAWRAVLWGVGRALKLELSARQVVGALWHVQWPLLLPAPVLMAVLGSGEGSFSWGAFIDACLRRQFAANPPWLPAVYFVAAAAALGLETRAVLRLSAGAEALRRGLHLGGSVVLLLAVVAVVGLVMPG